MRFPYKSSTIPSKVFFATIGTDILRICRAASSVAQFIRISKVFLHVMLRQGADLLGVKKILIKIFNRHALECEKYNTNNRDLIWQLLIYLLMLFYLNVCMYTYNLFVICVDVYVCQFWL